MYFMWLRMFLVSPCVQEHLEKNTEHLAELTETPLSKVDRTDVVNYTRVTQKASRGVRVRFIFCVCVHVYVLCIACACVC